MSALHNQVGTLDALRDTYNRTGQFYQNFSVTKPVARCHFDPAKSCRRAVGKCIDQPRERLTVLLADQPHMQHVAPPAQPGLDSGCNACQSQWPAADVTETGELLPIYRTERAA